MTDNVVNLGNVQGEIVPAEFAAGGLPEPGGEDEPALRITQRDAINGFSQAMAMRMVDLIHRGIDEDWFVMLYLDHAASLLARKEPRNTREQEVVAAVEKLKSFVARKVAQRRKAAKAQGRF